jgi:hypothetical protein
VLRRSRDERDVLEPLEAAVPLSSFTSDGDGLLSLIVVEG